MLVVTDELKIEELANVLLATIKTLVNSSIVRLVQQTSSICLLKLM